MDGFEQNEGIIVMAATNLPDVLDPALTRPGRFDRHIVVTNPDVRGRQEILELYLSDKPLAKDVDLKAIARGTPGFDGAGEAVLIAVDLTLLVTVALTIFKFVAVKQGCDFSFLGPFLLCTLLLLIAFGLLRSQEKSAIFRAMRVKQECKTSSTQ